MKRVFLVFLSFLILSVCAYADETGEVMEDDSVPVVVDDVSSTPDVLEPLPEDTEEIPPPVDSEESPLQEGESSLEEGQEEVLESPESEDDLYVGATLDDIYNLLNDSSMFVPPDSEEDSSDSVSVYALPGSLPCPYVYADVSGLGNVRIYFPINRQYNTFAYDDSDYLINITDSTVYGYVLGSTPYRIRFDSFGAVYYRDYDNDYSWRDTTVYPTDEGTLEILRRSIPLFPSEIYVQWLPVFLLGGLLVCQFMKH